MAYSPSPHTAIAGISTQIIRHSGSPPLRLPLSKRDKKRLNMADRLTEISNNFAANRDALYRQQLQTYQADINFIQSANPYENKLLEDPTQDQLDGVLNGGARIEPPFKTGRYSAKFVQEINDAMEKRDVDLTTLAVCPDLSAYECDYAAAVMAKLFSVVLANTTFFSTDITSALTKYKRTTSTKSRLPTGSISCSLRPCASVLSKVSIRRS